jgi:hypothetical protein
MGGTGQGSGLHREAPRSVIWVPAFAGMSGEGKGGDLAVRPPSAY